MNRKIRMYFILNKTIKFYPDTNELAIINEQDNSIVLSKPASRLLLTLINHLNVVVTRDYLLKTVWEDYGYTPSNNNLYMAISELRKSFSSLNGGESILVTVPKVGLRLEALVDALEKGGNAEEKKETRTETEIEPLAEEKPGEEEEKKISSIYRLKSNTGVKVKISLALILSSLAIFLFNLEENVPIKIL
ncbi:transcriptional regulatory protein [Erwinia tasmaniensis Et1/99]|uniref:Transcriptional regulatory protein n=2 Tax=Erwinia tasmaniensis TaxID=338565 RepID=B2VGZ0_ERWT9|nr:transcriptional regulatory protein [Erwinia tasmaniensis Et1/99]